MAGLQRRRFAIAGAASRLRPPRERMTAMPDAQMGRSGSAPDFAELLARAEALIPVLRERAAAGRGTAPPARRDDRRSASHRPLPHAAAEAGRRQRVAVPRAGRAGRGDRAAAAARPPGCWPTSRRITGCSACGTQQAQDEIWGAVARQSDRLGADLPARPRAPGRGRLSAHRPLAVFERRRRRRLEHDRRRSSRTRRAAAASRASSCCRRATTRSSTPGR